MATTGLKTNVLENKETAWSQGLIIQTLKEERFLDARKSWNPKEMGNKMKNYKKFTKVIDSEAEPLSSTGRHLLIYTCHSIGCVDINAAAYFCLKLWRLFYYIRIQVCRQWKCHHIKNNLFHMCEIIRFGVNELMSGISIQMWITCNWPSLNTSL